MLKTTNISIFISFLVIYAAVVECQRGASRSTTGRLGKKLNEPRSTLETNTRGSSPSKIQSEPIYSQLKTTDDLMLKGSTLSFQNGQDLILVVGNTGAGRTTIASLLTSDVDAKSTWDLESKWAGDGFLIEDSGNTISSANSTLITKSNFPNFKSNAKLSPVLDLSGFENTQGPPAELASALLNQNVSAGTNRVKILFVVNFSSLRTGESRIEFKNLVENAARFLPNSVKYSGAMALVVTKVGGLDELEGGVPSRDKVTKNVATFVTNLRGHLEDVVAEEARRTVMESILDAFLVKEGTKFERIVLVPVPGESGPLQKMPQFQRARQDLTSVLDKLDWVDTTSADFGTSLSERGLLFHQRATRALEDKILELLASVGTKLEAHFAELLKNGENLATLYENLRQLQSASAHIDALDLSESSRVNFFQVYSETLELDLGIKNPGILSDLAELSKVAGRLDFLDQFISEEERSFGRLAPSEWVALLQSTERSIDNKIYQVAVKLNAEVETVYKQLMRTQLIGIYKTKIQRADDLSKRKELILVLRNDAQRLTDLVSWTDEEASSLNSFLNETIVGLQELKIGVTERLTGKLSKLIQEKDIEFNFNGEGSGGNRPESLIFKVKIWVRHIEILLNFVRSERDKLDGIIRAEEQNEEVGSLRTSRNLVAAGQQETLTQLKQQLQKLQTATKEAELEALRRILLVQADGVLANEREEEEERRRTTTTTTTTTTTEPTTTMETTTVEPFTTLYSPVTTDWGEWGDWEFCPSGTFVSGFQLKVQPKVQGDNTALNAVNLLCTRRGSPTLVKTLKSSEGVYGWWGEIASCGQGSSAIGFQLMSEPDQKNGDDTAANNMKLFCDNRWTFIGSGTNWGKWTKERRCANSGLICGLRTQLDKSGDDDETAINNIAVKCCDHPDSSRLG